MLRKLALLTAALTLGAMVVPVATPQAAAPATAAPATIQTQCPVGSYSQALPPYNTYWHIGMLNGVRYWHTVNQSGNYVGSSVTGCGSSGEQQWAQSLFVSATSGPRCDPATSGIQYEYVGQYRHARVVGSFIIFEYYRYWHVRRLYVGSNFLVWLYDHSELARC